MHVAAYLITNTYICTLKMFVQAFFLRILHIKSLKSWILYKFLGISILINATREFKRGTLSLYKPRSFYHVGNVCFKKTVTIHSSDTAQCNGLKTGIKRTHILWLAIAVKTLSASISSCYLQLKHIKWQIFINFIFLSQFHYFIGFWWVHVQFKLQG